jgi:hypothetical protein
LAVFEGVVGVTIYVSNSRTQSSSTVYTKMHDKPVPSLYIFILKKEGKAAIATGYGGPQG